MGCIGEWRVVGCIKEKVNILGREKREAGEEKEKWGVEEMKYLWYGMAKGPGDSDGGGAR